MLVKGAGCATGQSSSIGEFVTLPLQFKHKRCNYFDVNTEGRMLEWKESGICFEANVG